jgi:hypothetical protein
MAKFRNVEFKMTRGNGYGQYIISAKYKGVDINVHTTNSQAFDWCEDESNKSKNNEARKYCYTMIKNQYNSRG